MTYCSDERRYDEGDDDTFEHVQEQTPYILHIPETRNDFQTAFFCISFMKNSNDYHKNVCMVAMIPMMIIVKVITRMTMAVMKTTITYIACLWVHGSSELDFRATPSIIPERVTIEGRLSGILSVS